MPFDSLVRTKQVNKPEFSGYIVDVLLQYLKSGSITGIAMNTGQLSGQFYPLRENPSGYLTSSDLSGYATEQYVTNADTTTLAYVYNTYYPSTNPSGYITSGELTGMGEVTGTITIVGTGGITVTGVGDIIYISGDGTTDNLTGYVPWTYFLSGWNQTLPYISLADAYFPGKFIFGNASHQYLLDGYRTGYPSEKYFIDFYGNSADTYGLSYTRPTIYGFDISGGSIRASGYPVLTTKDLTGLASWNQLLITSGELEDTIWNVRTEVIQILTGTGGYMTVDVTGKIFSGQVVLSGIGGTQILDGGGQTILVSGGAGSVSIATGGFVDLGSTQTIWGQKSFSGLMRATMIRGVFGKSSIDFINYRLNNADSPVLDWTGQKLIDYDYGKTTLNWNTRTTFDSGDVVSIDWGNRKLAGNWDFTSGTFTFSGNRIATGNVSVGGVSGIRVTGLTISGIVTISGQGGILPYITGNTLIISGSPGSGGSSVTSGVAGVTGLSVSGQIPLTGYVQLIGQSGIQLTQGVSGITIALSASANSYLFNSGVTSGVTEQFISFPIDLGSNPTVLASVSSASNNTIIPFMVSGETSSGFWVNFGANIPDNSYEVNVLASTNTMTGLITQVTNNTYNYFYAAASGVSTLTVTGQSISGDVGMTGVGGTVVSLSGNSIVISGGSTINTGGFVTTGQTGQFYASNNPSGFVTSGQLGGLNTGSFITTGQTGAFASAVNLNATGSKLSGNDVDLQNQITTINNKTGSFVVGPLNTGAFVVTGQTGQFYASNNPSGFVTSGQLGGLNTGSFITTGQTGAFASAVNLTSTGAILSGQIQALSGYAVSISGSTVNLSGQTVLITNNLNTTGQKLSGIDVSLQSQITTINNKTGVFITTGQTGAFASQVNFASLSGNLSGQTVNLSGQTAMIVAKTGTFVTSAQTGAFLTSGYGVMTLRPVTGFTTGNPPTGVVATVSGHAILSGAGGVSLAYSGQTITISGTTGNFVTQDKTGVFITTSQTGQFYASNNPSGYITSAQISGTGVTYIAGLTAVIGVQGLGNISISTGAPNDILISGSTGSLASASNLAATGAFLQSEIVIISGTTGSFITTSQTGAFASQVNFATLSGDVSGQISTLTANLNTTGQKLSGIDVDLQSQITTINNKTGNFVVGPLNTGAFVVTGQTGQFAPYSNTVFLTGAQNITGIKYFNDELHAFKLAAYSGAVLSMDAISRVLYNKAEAVSINWDSRLLTGGPWAAQDLIVSGFPVATGGPYYPLSNPAGYITAAQVGGVQSITATGVTISGNVHMTGIGNLVTITGNVITITSQTGTLASAVNLAATGAKLSGNDVDLQNQITGITNKTGTFITSAQTGAFASVVNLNATGAKLSGNDVDLQNQITTINNKTGVFITTAQTGAFASVVNLNATGSKLSGNDVDLQNQITTINNKTGTFISSAVTGQFAAADQVVYVTGSQTIAGTKTFTDTVNARIITNSGQRIDLGSGLLTNNTWSLNRTVFDWQNASNSLSGTQVGWQTPTLQVGTLLDFGTTGPTVVDVTNHRLIHDSAATVLDWSNSILQRYAPYTDTVMNWYTLTFYGGWNFASGATASGQNVTTGGPYYPLLSNPSGYITSAQAGGVQSITVTGTTISGAVKLTGVSGVGIRITGDTITIGVSTGQFASSVNLSTVSGNLNTTGQKLSGIDVNLQSQITTISNKTGTFVTTAQTGAFASQVNFASLSGNLSGQTALLTSNLNTTGQTLSGIDVSLQSQITTINNKTGTFITSAVTGQFAAANQVVYTTGDQTIGGDKTFSNTVNARIITNSGQRIDLGSGLLTNNKWSADRTVFDWKNASNSLSGTQFGWQTPTFQVGTILDFGTSGPTVIDVTNHRLIHSSAATALDFSNLTLQRYAPYTDTVMNWYNLTFYGGWNFASGLTVSGQNVTTGGPYYPLLSNPSGYITSAQAGGVQSITVTGTTISGVVKLTGVSGVGILITGDTITIGVSTGQFASSINLSTVSGNLNTTGQKLSGIDVNLQSQITTINNKTGTFVTSAQTGQFASSNQVVYTTGNQIITGVKTFSNINLTGRYPQLLVGTGLSPNNDRGYPYNTRSIVDIYHSGYMTGVGPVGVVSLTTGTGFGGYDDQNGYFWQFGVYACITGVGDTIISSGRIASYSELGADPALYCISLQWPASLAANCYKVVVLSNPYNSLLGGRAYTLTTGTGVRWGSGNAFFEATPPILIDGYTSTDITSASQLQDDVRIVSGALITTNRIRGNNADFSGIVRGHNFNADLIYSKGGIFSQTGYAYSTAAGYTAPTIPLVVEDSNDATSINVALMVRGRGNNPGSGRWRGRGVFGGDFSSVSVGEYNQRAVIAGHASPGYDSFQKLYINTETTTANTYLGNTSTSDIAPILTISSSSGKAVFGAPVGVGVVRPFALLHISGNTGSAANFVPLKFDSGSLVASPETGALEYDGLDFYVTNGLGSRAVIATGVQTGSFVDDGTFVRTTGTQTISGIKTVAQRLLINSADALSSPRNSTDAFIARGTSAGGQLAWLYTTTSTQPYIGVEALNGEYALFGVRSTAEMFFQCKSTTGRFRLEQQGGGLSRMICSGIGLSIPNATAQLTIAGNPGTAGFTPIRFYSGTLTATPQTGALEYDGKNLYLTNGSGDRVRITTGDIGGSAGVNSLTISGGQAYAGDLVLTGLNGITISGSGAQISFDAVSRKVITPSGTFYSPTGGVSNWKGLNTGNWFVDWRSGENFSYSFMKDTNGWVWQPYVYMTGCIEGKTIYVTFVDTGANLPASSVHPFGWSGEKIYWSAGGQTAVNTSWITPTYPYGVNGNGSISQPHFDVFMFTKRHGKVFGTKILEDAYDGAE